MNRFTSRLLTAGVLAAASCALLTASATGEQEPARPNTFRCYHPEVDFHSANASRRAVALSESKWDNSDGHDTRGVPTDGQRKALVLLISFSDKDFVTPDAYQVFHDMLNKEGFNQYGASGSARDFYVESSRGEYLPDFDVYGPIKMPKPARYYGEDMVYSIDMHPAEMVEQACLMWDDKINFADYDTNGDGFVDNVYVFYAGKGQTTGGDQNTIWPHAASLTDWYVDNNADLGKFVPLEVDGVKVNRYAMSCEVDANNNLSGIGTFVHEFGHVLGLPDLYDTANNGSYSKCFTPNYFSTMDLANYLNNEHTPALFSTYERYSLEWMKPYECQGDAEVCLLPLSNGGNALKVGNTKKPTEYYLFESRARDGWDKYIPGEGLLVWHIDYTASVWEANKVNNNADRQLVDIIEADNDLYIGSQADDVFPGKTAKHDFETNSDPSIKWWDRSRPGMEFFTIYRNPDGAVFFKLRSNDGKRDAAMEIAAPAAKLSALGSNFATAEWSPVSGAKEYRVSLVQTSDNKVVTRLENVGNATSFEFSGLKPATGYAVYVYACNDLNVAAAETPIYFTTQGAGAANRPVVFSTTHANGADLSWAASEGASAYKLTIAERTTGAKSDEEASGFDGDKLPASWSFSGSFEKASSRVGTAAPSLRFDNDGTYLQTRLYDKPVRSISFWTRFEFDDDEAFSYLTVYGLDKDGHVFPIETINDLADDSKGETKTIEFTRDVYGVRLVHNMRTTSQSLYIDDVVVELCDSHTDTPVAGYNGVEVADVKAAVEGLDEGKKYIAYVEPVDGAAAGKRSEAHEFITVESTGVGSIIGDAAQSVHFYVNNGFIIPTDNGAEYSVFSISGACIASGVKGSFELPAKGIYMVRSGSAAAKLVW